MVLIKDNNPYLKLLWLKYLAKRGTREKAILSDKDCINRLYFNYCGNYPDLENPQKFSEKMQWLKLYYRNELMPICADKYLVRQYLTNVGKEYLLNDILAVYDDLSQFDLSILPRQFVLKASHSSGWNLIVRDKNSMQWWIWKKHLQYWLTHSIEWNGREWHYGRMKHRIIVERYLEDKSGGLMDYKFFCFNGVPMFLQVNVARGSLNATQNYYDLKWNLLPFGKSQPYNPNIQIEKPVNFELMIKEASELSKPFPFVRIDFYEANGKIFFGEFTFFPCSGMPDFIPAVWDNKVGEMLTLPEANNTL